MKVINRIISLVILLALLTSLLTGCTLPTRYADIDKLNITNAEDVTLKVGRRFILLTDAPSEVMDELSWYAVGDSVSVDDNGIVTALAEGMSIVKVKYGSLSDSVVFNVVSENLTEDSGTPGGDSTGSDSTGGDSTGGDSTGGGNVDIPGGDVVIPTEDPYVDMTDEEFYANYTPATSNEDAAYRTAHGFMSGLLTVPDQAPEVSAYQPSYNGVLLRNSDTYFSADRDTYTVVDAYGQKVMEIYRDGAYITLEDVAAYVYAFGDVPKNYVSDKKTKPYNSIWGEYLRLNNTYFSGNTSKYPYEPVLPDISGCGGRLDYYEIDIGTTGTTAGNYEVDIYNDGSSITRGAARIVYVRYDENDDLVIDPNERYVFYTYNHYNDFQEYLNYYGGWGEMFGNITGGGTLSSKTNYNPTPYVEVERASFTAGRTVAVVIVAVLPREEYL